jgi:predicted HAD superfamily Cof-like phosphohydrolase
MEIMENRYIEAVTEFHKTFGHPIGSRKNEPDLKLTILRYNLLQEEVTELATALMNRDGEEVLDALVDIQYILSGTVVAFGLQQMFDEAFEEVHASNMSKLGEDGKPIYREDGKILKGPNYFKPDLGKIIDRHFNAETNQGELNL